MPFDLDLQHELHIYSDIHIQSSMPLLLTAPGLKAVCKRILWKTRDGMDKIVKWSPIFGIRILDLRIGVSASGEQGMNDFEIEISGSREQGDGISYLHVRISSSGE